MTDPMQTDTTPAERCIHCGLAGLTSCPVGGKCEPGPALASPPAPSGLAEELAACDYEWHGPFGREKWRFVKPDLFDRILTALSSAPADVREAETAWEATANHMRERMIAARNFLVIDCPEDADRHLREGIEYHDDEARAALERTAP